MNPNANVYIPESFPCSSIEREKNHCTFAEEMERQGFDNEVFGYECRYNEENDTWSKLTSRPDFSCTSIYRFAEPQWRAWKDVREMIEDAGWDASFKSREGYGEVHGIWLIDVKRNTVALLPNTSSLPVSMEALFNDYDLLHDGERVPAGRQCDE